MAKRIITISREFGSGGRFIGEETAKKLGIDYYDKDIIGQIAGQSGLSETKPADWKYVTTIHYLASGMGSTIYNHMWGRFCRKLPR